MYIALQPMFDKILCMRLQAALQRSLLLQSEECSAHLEALLNAFICIAEAHQQEFFDHVFIFPNVS